MMDEMKLKRMYDYMAKFTNPEMNGHILAEKMGDAIVNMGDELEKQKILNDELKVMLEDTKSNLQKLRDKRNAQLKANKRKTANKGTKMLAEV